MNPNKEIDKRGNQQEAVWDDRPFLSLATSFSLSGGNPEPFPAWVTHQGDFQKAPKPDALGTSAASSLLYVDKQQLYSKLSDLLANVRRG